MAASRKKKLRVAVIFGGKSGEHEVSIKSATAVIAHLDSQKYAVEAVKIGKDGAWRPDVLDVVDVAFPLVHGTFGEDGALQGLLEMAGVPYVGSGVLGSALGMDKVVQKRLLMQAGLPIVPFTAFIREEWDAAPLTVVRRIERALRYPMFVKPANLGSSVGITKAHHRRELLAGIDEAFRYDEKIIIEQGIEKAREIECGVIGGARPRTSALGEVVPSNEFYDYEAKYVSGTSKIIIPAAITKRLAASVRDLACRAFTTLCAYGMARVDFFVGGDRAIVINEINTVPGFTEQSMFAKLWDASGLPFGRLLDELIALAIARATAQRRLSRAYDAPQRK